LSLSDSSFSFVFVAATFAFFLFFYDIAVAVLFIADESRAVTSFFCCGEKSSAFLPFPPSLS
jgi:hypothetical protein